MGIIGERKPPRYDPAKKCVPWWWHWGVVWGSARGCDRPLHTWAQAAGNRRRNRKGPLKEKGRFRQKNVSVIWL